MAIKGKTITFLSLNFFPEDTAIGLYSTQMVDALIDAGAIVKVVTAVPYYPQWRIQPPYDANSSFTIDRYRSSNVYRYKFYVPAQPTFKKRVRHIMSFTYGAWKNLKNIDHSDLVISIIPFTSSAWLGSKLAKKHKCPHWIHIQDFEFDAAMQSGLAGGKVIFNQLFKLEKSILDKAKTVSTISYKMINKLSQKTNSETYYLPNWIAQSKNQNTTHSLHQFMHASKFNLLYSGNVGEKQDWDFFIAFAKALSPQYYQISIVGAGAKYQELKELVGLDHVKFYPPVPLDQLNQLLNSADAHFLFQKTEVQDTVMPSKLLGMMASGKPSLILGNPESEVRTILESSNAGTYISEAVINKTIAALEEWRINPESAMLTGNNAKNYVLKHFSKEKILGNWIEQLESIL